MDPIKDEPVMVSFPFSAIVGNQQAKDGLVCALSSPGIKAVLICGPKGSGKSLLARSMEHISGGRSIVVLPMGVTEDRVFGAMDIEGTIRDGIVRLDRSLVSRADGNILLVENANLMNQDILHQILNIAETRTSTVERDGTSGTETCDTLVVATMDPSEGDVSEHILDRFDMCIFTSNMEDEDERSEVVERNLEFSSDPIGFCERYRDEDLGLEELIARSRDSAVFIRIPEGYCRAVTQLCMELGVSGHRGDISVINASCALAAMDGRETVDRDDLKTAAALCLEHRRRNDSDDERDDDPPEEPPPQQDQEDSEPEQDQNNEPQDEPPDREPPVPDVSDMDQESSEDSDTEEEVFAIGETFDVIDYMPPADDRLKRGRSGRRSGSTEEDPSGRCIGYRIPRGRIRDIALCASIRAAAPYQVIRDHSDLAIVLEGSDLREKVRELRRGNDILFLVDGSGSIGAQNRMVAVKGAILSMLKDAYQKRDRVGMVVFRTDHAEEVLPLTKSTLRAYNALSTIPTGGRTPITHGLLKGHEVLSRENGGGNPVMVILSDGRCNKSLEPGRKPLGEMLETARGLAGSGIRFIVVDTEAGKMNLGLAMDLCRELDGTYLRLEELNADNVFRSVRRTIDDF